MAFQTGTKVDPRLMKADLSGFTRGTELAMAGLGAAIKGYATKKKENEQIDFAAETLAGQMDNPYVRGLFGISEADAKNITAADLKKPIKAFGGAKAAMDLSGQISLITTKADVERSSLKRQKSDLKGLGELLKTQGIKDAGGYLEFDLPQSKAFTTGDKKKFGLEDTKTDPRLATLYETYGPLLESMYPEQFGSTTTPSTVDFTKDDRNQNTSFTGFSIVED